jgi:hypothetical protein
MSRREGLMRTRGAHEQPTKPNWLRRATWALLLILGGASAVLTLPALLNADEVTPTAIDSPPASTSETGPTTLSPVPTPEPRDLSDAELRASFIQLATRENWPGAPFPPADQLPALGQHVCSVLAPNTEASVYAAAGELEAMALTTDPAWGFVNLAAVTYCPQHSAVVIDITVAMAD